MASFRTRRTIVAAGSVAAVVAAPAIALFAGLSGPAPSAVADCSGGINMNIMSEGVPISNCPLPASSGPSGGAPSEGLLTSCSNEPGCLSYNMYGPGNVQVPNRSTKVQQSQ